MPCLLEREYEMRNPCVVCHIRSASRFAGAGAAAHSGQDTPEGRRRRAGLHLEGSELEASKAERLSGQEERHPRLLCVGLHRRLNKIKKNVAGWYRPGQTRYV